MLAAAAVLLAWARDAACGEARNAWHPVAWFGRATAPLGLRLLRLRPAAAFVCGALAWTCAIAAAATAGRWLQAWIATQASWLALPLLALALKPGFAWRMLKDEVRAVDAALQQGLDGGRQRLARLCSRDVGRLDAGAVRGTAIESLAEKLNDSLVVPLAFAARVAR
jgi:adenosylcobinamide-phosphate synthase